MSHSAKREIEKLPKIELPAGTPCWKDGWMRPVPNKNNIMCYMHRVDGRRIYASYCCDQSNMVFWLHQDGIGSMAD